jgi:hypothetical protein
MTLRQVLSAEVPVKITATQILTVPAVAAIQITST